MSAEGRTSIIVVAWNHKRFLADCVRALERAVPLDGSVRLMLVDNASTDGTAELVRGELLAPSGGGTKGGLPCVFVESGENLGFSGGNNLAIRKALEDGDEWVYLLNPDTEAAPGFLEEAKAVAEAEPAAGIVQSLLLLEGGEKVNSWGNAIHYLGFGYAGGESVPLVEAREKGMLEVRDIAYASGAGMLVRSRVFRDIGLLDEELFAYHEDLEFSWRARLAGYRVLLAPESVVEHKYEFSRSIKKYRWMERNRAIVALRLYRLPTLLLLFPAWLAMELGLWAFALRSGWWKEKLRASAYFLKPSSWRKLIAARTRAQSLRVVSDREATRLFAGRILFQQMSPMLLTRVANPVFQAYWKLAHFLMIW